MSWTNKGSQAPDSDSRAVGNKSLSQSTGTRSTGKAHENSDVDSSEQAQHHTLGMGSFQAARGSDVADIKRRLDALDPANATPGDPGPTSAEFTALKSQVTSLNGSVGSLSGQVSTLAGQVAGIPNYSSQITALQNRATALESQVTGLDMALYFLGDAIGQTQQTLSGYRADYTYAVDILNYVLALHDQRLAALEAKSHKH